MKNRPKAALTSLYREIEHHNHLYYVLDDPEIPDAAYDRLLKKLIDLEQAYPDLVSADSPTRRVGDTPLESLGEVVGLFAHLVVQLMQALELVFE